MATSPEFQHEGSLWSTLVTEGVFPASLRKEGVDESAKLTYLTRKWVSPFTWMLHNKFKSSVTNVKDRKYISREVSELDRFYTVTVTSGNGVDANVERVFGLSNYEAAQIQPGDVLYCKSIYSTVITHGMVAGQVYAASGGVQGTNVGPDMGWSTGGNPTDVKFSRSKGLLQDGYYYCDPEPLLVINKGAVDSGGTGHTFIFVRRHAAGPGAHDEGGRLVDDATVYGTAANLVGIYNNMNHGDASARIRVGDVLLRGTPAFKEGTGYPSGVYKNPISDMNFTQLYKYALEETLESRIPALWIKDRPFDITRWMTLIRANRDREYANLLGRKGMTKDATDGREMYFAGGVREFIPKDSDHYIVYPHATLDWPSMLDLSKAFLNLNNSGQMWGITGVSLDIKLRTAYYNSHLFYNKEESKNFNMEVNTLVLSGVEINLIKSQIMEEAGFGNELLCLDMTDGDSFEPVTHEGWDYRVDNEIATPGTNVHKEGIQGMFGLRRRKKNHHCIVDFCNAVTI